MSKQPNLEPMDNDNPEWTAQEAATAKRFGALPESLQAKLRGRPKAAIVKERLTIRIDPDTLARWRASGPGWQTRAAELLAKMAP